MDSVKFKAYGKLNLYLDVVGRRDDGYHLLRSVMQSVSVYDLLKFTLSEGEGIRLVCDDANFPKDSSNLIWKAVTAFYEYAGVAPRGRLTVTVEKNIPSMAGMAGGSADCSAALAALNVLYGDPLDSRQINELGSRLGADVPFTSVGGTVLCEGIGEKLTVLPEVKNIYFAAVQPNVRISTPEAYKAYDSRPMLKKKSYPQFEQAVRLGEPQLIADGMFNALEAAADVPEITEAKEKLIACGALGALMTGSGSVVFGVFDSKKKALECTEKLSGEEYPYTAVLEPVSKGLEMLLQGRKGEMTYGKTF